MSHTGIPQDPRDHLRSRNGAYVLWLVRDGQCRTWGELCRHFGITSPLVDSFYYALSDIVRRLRDAGLLDGNSAEEPDDSARLSVSDRWPAIQTALNISLVQVAGLTRDSFVARPLFGPPGKLDGAADVFVVMPFDEAMRPVYEDHVRPAVERLDRSCVRGDDFSGSASVMSEVWSGIAAASVVVADCTGRNPNVFYEIGVAHTVGKPVVLITQRFEDIPFDVRHIRFIKYDYTPRGMRQFEDTLTQSLRDVFQDME